MAQPASRALLVFNGEPSPADRHLAAVVDFFGIASEPVPADNLLRPGAGEASAGGSYSVLCSAPVMAALLGDANHAGQPLPGPFSRATSVFLFGFQETDACNRLLRLLAGSAGARIRRAAQPQAPISISSAMPEVCGPMSGLTFSAELGDSTLFELGDVGPAVEVIAETPQGALFVRARFQGVDIYFSAPGAIADLSAPREANFDVREQFTEAVPLVMFLQSAFRGACWTSPETSACLIVDDPTLRPRYGFLRFQELVEMMDRWAFTTTLAFIPWNWRRTSAQTIALFRQNRGRLSLCMHGCDHTAGEFASRSGAELNGRLKSAARRMESLEKRSELPCDRVMVFPQGRFSPESGRALKLNGYSAAVNTVVAPANGAPNATTLADLWSPAITKYGTFPIYTRRYMDQGVENFAFDALLGKPCFIASHHDLFENGARVFTEFLVRLNALPGKLRWRSLGDAVDRGYLVRRRGEGSVEVRMFASSLAIENQSAAPVDFEFTKPEGDPGSVQSVNVNSAPIEFRCEGGTLEFRARLGAGQKADVRVGYLDTLEAPLVPAGLGYRFRTALRRYLSEFRDNHLSQHNALYARVMSLRKRME
jgi:hypothetical protein